MAGTDGPPDHVRLTLNEQVHGLAHPDSILSRSLVNSKHFGAVHVQLDTCFDCAGVAMVMICYRSPGHIIISCKLKWKVDAHGLLNLQSCPAR